MNAPLHSELQELNETPTAPAFQEYLRIFSRHRYSILGLMLLVGVLGGLRAALEVPIFRSTSTMLIERDIARYVQVQEVYGAQAGGFEYYQTQYEILRTMPLAERTAEAVGPQKILDGMNHEAAFSWGKLFGSKPPPAPELTAAQKLDVAARIVQGSLTIEPIRNSQLVRMSFSLPDRELAAELANAHGRSYIRGALDARVEMVREATDFLSGRTAQMRTDLEAAERALEEFKRREGLVDPSGTDNLSSQELTMLSSQIATAQSDRLQVESLYTQITKAEASRGGLEAIPALLSDPAVLPSQGKLDDARKRAAELGSRYGPQHPDMVRVRAEIEAVQRELDASLKRAAQQAKLKYETARQIEGNLRGQYEAARGRLQHASGKAIELGRLERDLDAKRQVYEKFQTQFNETTGVKDLDTANARMVELARPGDAPVYPNIRRSAMVALLFGLVLGVALAFVLDHLDSTIKTADDVERRLQTPVIGLIPTLKTSGKKDTGPMRHFTENPQSGFAESVRTARTNILLSAIGKQHKRLLVTSSVPSEGKTTMALNLAQSFSHMNKVLLIDADMRRPSVSRVFGADAPPSGLSQFIAGEARISECVRQVEGNGPFIMTAGVIPPNPLELLSSPRFSEALDSLGKVFDYIVIDCAPTLAVSDALVLAKLVDGVIYVVKADSTPYQAAQSGVRRLRRIDAPLMGVLLNRIGERPHGYGYGRYSYYADGYYAYSSYYNEKKRDRKK